MAVPDSRQIFEHPFQSVSCYEEQQRQQEPDQLQHLPFWGKEKAKYKNLISHGIILYNVYVSDMNKQLLHLSQQAK